VQGWEVKAGARPEPFSTSVSVTGLDKLLGQGGAW
jgi:hypothetical protein